MNKEAIKGMCENCGIAYMGEVVTDENGAFPRIECPACKVETENFDHASEVERRQKDEQEKLVYTTYSLTVIK